MAVYLRDFKVIRPNYEHNQETVLDWIVKAHVNTQMKLSQWKAEDPECLEFSEKLRKNLFKLGLGKNKIQKRSFQIDDCNHLNWEEMQIYNIDFAPEGYHLDKRMEFFNKSSLEIFEGMYPEGEELPPHLVHVTCTGYVAPSPAQQLVSLRSNGKNTMVTHAYHMGCYGSIPSIRIGMGHYFVESEQTDIVHTEFSSIHMNPSLHSMDQLVGQSLFADGFIKYSLGEYQDSPSFKILTIKEELISNSITKMTWTCHNWGFKMWISKDIPVIIRRSLDGYLKNLAKKAGRDLSELKSAKYAIHPGGPKIIEQIAETLELKHDQIRHSKAILQNCGNMSSATLPHIWEQMLQDDEIQSGELIVSLAFGPGLSISGSLFEMRR